MTILAYVVGIRGNPRPLQSTNVPAPDFSAVQSQPPGHRATVLYAHVPNKAYLFEALF